MAGIIVTNVIEWQLVDKAREFARMSDIDLREAFDELICQVYQDHVDRNDLADEFFWFIAETFERFAPSVEAEFNRRHNVDGADGMRQTIERMAVGHAARLTRVAETQGGDDA